MRALSNFVMSRPFRIEISESQEELEKALKHATTASSKERLQMLYWVKSGQVSSRRSLAEGLGRDQATITRWVRKYKDEGKKGLLKVKHAPGKVAIISGSDLERLKQRLQEPSGLTSYGQIQQWIHNELGLSLAYKTVYEIVRQRLGAKLKVPRPQSTKQHPQSLCHFKKNCL